MSRAEKTLLALLVATILFAPVFFGGVGRFHRDWTAAPPTALEAFLWANGPYAILSMLGVAVAATALAVALERRAAGEPEPWRLHAPLLLPFAGLAALALLQMVPLPRPVLGLLSPGTARALETLLPGDASWRPVTVSPEGTRAALGGLALGGAVLLGTLLVARRRAAAMAVLGAVVAAFALSAVYGILSTRYGDDTVLGFPKVSSAGMVTGTFLNRNNLAGAAGLALPLALALLAVSGPGRGPAGLTRAGALSLAAAILAVAIPLARARMGLAAAAGGIVVLGLLGARAVRWPRWGRALVVLAAVGAAGGSVFVVLRAMPELRERFQAGPAEHGYLDTRIPAWASTVRLAQRYPAFGTGLGTYEAAIHETQTAENPLELYHAHSEPLEALAEGGVAGLALAVLLALGAAAACLRAAASDDPLVRAVGCGCGGGLAALLAGSFAEFHLHIPALGLAALVVAAVPAALAAGEPAAPPREVPGRRVGLLAALAVVVLAAFSLGAGARDAALRGAAVRAEQGGDATGWLASARAWVEATPSDASARRSLALALLNDGAPAGGTAAAAEDALGEADRAVAHEPFHAYGHWARGLALLTLGRNDEAVAAIARARSRAGGIGHLHLAAGSALLYASVADPGLRPAALEALREAGSILPEYFSRAWALMENLRVPPLEREAAVPDRGYGWGAAAEYWGARGDRAREIRARVRVLRLHRDDTAYRMACLEVARQSGLLDYARDLLREAGLPAE